MGSDTVWPRRSPQSEPTMRAMVESTSRSFSAPPPARRMRVTPGVREGTATAGPSALSACALLPPVVELQRRRSAPPQRARAARHPCIMPASKSSGMLVTDDQSLRFDTDQIPVFKLNTDGVLTPIGRQY